MSGDGQALRTDKLTLQTILHMGYKAYARTHALPDSVRRAVWALLTCRTAVLGGHVQACPEGHLERIWYNSCRHRMCPQCAWIQIERWLARQKARLLVCDHYHVIFTIPHELNDLWLANVTVMTQLLFASVHDTLRELLGDGKYLGARAGIIATLHTWTQTLLLHPHLKLGRTKWHVHIRERYPHGQGVLVYLARYLRGGPLANRRLLSCDGEQVIFRYDERPKDPARPAQRRTMRLSLNQFLGRWLRHIPPPHAVLVRCWGLYAHTQGDELARCRQQLGQGPIETPVLLDEPHDRQGWGEALPECCPVCGQRLVCTALLPRTGVPPPAEPGWEQVA